MEQSAKNTEPAFAARVRSALAVTSGELLREAEPEGRWTGTLSSSALSTATAITALGTSRCGGGLIQRGAEWLERTQNADGGWGDTTLSKSNLSTTVLCWAALRYLGSKYDSPVHRADKYISGVAGSPTPVAIASAVIQRYGKDRTFSVPILTMAAICGCLGDGEKAWDEVLQLPFELAAVPPRFFAAVKMPVVSYALPALIAIGLAKHVKAPSRNPIARGLRNAVRGKVLRKLELIQPGNGGFLEATPLTSFVVMSLVAAGEGQHAVAEKGRSFLLSSVRADGSWPIDTNLCTWLTTMAVNALGKEFVSARLRQSIREGLLRQQYRSRHEYTNAAPGGWSWTDLPGGVPDADDTAGAVLALAELGAESEEARMAAQNGLIWLLGLQNSDGGIPTFCRGWGHLPFDESSPDITAHFMRAARAWEGRLDERIARKVEGGVRRAARYLLNSQVQSGARTGLWRPLWFGNEHEPDENNYVYGTSRVLLALKGWKDPRAQESISKGAAALCAAQNPDGSWGAGGPGGSGTIEETSLSLEALAACESEWRDVERLRATLIRGTEWLLGKVVGGTWKEPSPIGFYFAKLWYYERLYPVIMTNAALREVSRCEWMR